MHYNGKNVFAIYYNHLVWLQCIATGITPLQYTTTALQSHYNVSSMKTHPHHHDYDITEEGKVFSRKKNRFLTHTIDGNGYERVSLYIKGKGTRTFYVHKLVAETYIVNSLDYKFVGHKDGDRTNNKVNNLFWRKQSRSPTEHELYLERNRVLEYKKFLEEHGYIVLDQVQARKVMDRIRQT